MKHPILTAALGLFFFNTFPLQAKKTIDPTTQARDVMVALEKELSL